MSDRIQLCRTEYNYVGENTILSTKLHSVGQYNSVGQNAILSNGKEFCRTEYNSVGQNTILLDRIVFCLTELYSVDRILDVTNGAP